MKRYEPSNGPDTALYFFYQEGRGGRRGLEDSSSRQWRKVIHKAMEPPCSHPEPMSKIEQPSEPLAQGASRFEKLLAPRKIYWPPFFPDRRLYS